MSFSSNIKEELSKLNNLSKKNQVYRELIGYLISANTICKKNKYKFSTENEHNINRFSKLLKNCEIIDFDINLKRAVYSIEFKNILIKKFLEKKDEEIKIDFEENNVLLKVNGYDDELDKALIRGIFLGSGYINNPEKKYHLEINFNQKQNSIEISDLLKEYGVNTKIIEKENSSTIYIKEADEISKFLAFIGANGAVLKFEEDRVLRDTRNNLNRLINCETANMTKTIQAGLKQIEDIQLIKRKKEFSKMPENLQIVANLRLKNPEASLNELIEMMGNSISKSGLSHRLAAISKIAEELRKSE